MEVNVGGPLFTFPTSYWEPVWAYPGHSLSKESHLASKKALLPSLSPSSEFTEPCSWSMAPKVKWTQPASWTTVNHARERGKFNSLRLQMNNIIRRPRNSLMRDLRPHIFLLLLETVSGTSLTCRLSQDTAELQSHETWHWLLSIPAPPLLPRCVPLDNCFPWMDFHLTCYKWGDWRDYTMFRKGEASRAIKWLISKDRFRSNWKQDWPWRWQMQKTEDWGHSYTKVTDSSLCPCIYMTLLPSKHRIHVSFPWAALWIVLANRVWGKWHCANVRSWFLWERSHVSPLRILSYHPKKPDHSADTKRRARDVPCLPPTILAILAESNSCIGNHLGFSGLTEPPNIQRAELPT